MSQNNDNNGRWKIMTWSLGIIFSVYSVLMVAAIGATHSRLSFVQEKFDNKIESIESFNKNVINKLSSIETKLNFIIEKRLR